jgi:adenylosuccinate synthase
MMMTDFGRCVPIYAKFSGWQKDISQLRKFSDLPKEAKIYLKFIEKELKVPIKIISVGAERSANIIL